MVGHRIIKTEVTDDGVIIKLQNGVEVRFSSNPDFLHLHFSGIIGGISATSFAYTEAEKLSLANYVDIEYSPSREEDD